MIRSDSRIRVTHQGALPRPAELETLVRARAPITGRDRQDFPESFASRMLGGGYPRIFQCTAPLTYVGMHGVLIDIASLEAATAGQNVEDLVIAGTDCGIGSRVSTAEIAWAKLAASVEGARITQPICCGTEATKTGEGTP